MSADSEATRVAILDDHAILAEGVSHLIKAESDIDVCGVFSDANNLAERLKASSVDILIMDLQLGEESVVGLIRELSYQLPALKVLVFTFLDSKNYVHDAIAYGALGFLSKSSRQQQMVEALRSVAAGKHFFGAELGASVANVDDGEIPVKLLSNRELEVLKRLALGFSPKEIGFELELSDKTIHARKNSIRQKLGLRRQSDLIRAAFSAGIVTVHDLVG